MKPKIVVVLPAYNAARTVERTVRDIPPGCADELLLVDDASRDETVAVAQRLGLTVIRHNGEPRLRRQPKNLLPGSARPRGRHRRDASPRLPIRRAVDPFFDRVHRERRLRRDVRIPGPHPPRGAGRRHAALQIHLQPVVDGAGKRGVRAEPGGNPQRLPRLLPAGPRALPWDRNSDDFVFDQQFIAQAVHFGFRLGDVPVPTRYERTSSSINFRRSAVYGLETLWTLARYLLHRWKIWSSPLFTPRSS
jgi:hypothetical protein